MREWINLVERVLPNSAKAVEELLLSNGWERVGSGHYAEVFSKPNIDYVVKVFERDSAYLAYLDLITKYPNSHFPKIKGAMWISREYNGVRLEKLLPMQPVSVDGYTVSISGMLNAYLIEKRYTLNSIQVRNRELSKIYLADKPELVEALDLIHNGLIVRHNCGLDLSDHNIMMRSDGTPVIIDPVYQ
jgi:hypothetical protein